MEFLLSLWDVIDKILGVVLLAAGVLGFVFRTWIKAWIENKFTSAAAAALENRRHELNQQLEAYKGSVMRDLEQFRANIDIKRSVALKVAGERLDALRTLATTLDKYTNDAVARSQSNLLLRNAHAAEMIASTQAAQVAYRAAEIFLPLDFNVEIASLMATMQELVVDFGPENENALAPNDARIEDILERYATVANRLREEIFRVPPDLI